MAQFLNLYQLYGLYRFRLTLPGHKKWRNHTMANELQPLSLLFQNRLFRIPDYQRGYAWLRQQLVDFWEDLINLQPDRFHYTGLLSLRPLKSKETVSWGEDLWLVENGYKPCHIVDGQQRITTFVVLLNEIVGFVRGLEENKGKSDKEIILGCETVEEIVSKYICRKRPPNGMVTTYLFGYEVDNPSAEYMKYKVFEEPYAGAVNETYYTKNLKFAKNFFAENIKKLYEESGENGLEAVNSLYKKLTQKLMFNLNEIDDDYDVFVAFETMNNRGKKLTNLELLKNRLIYLTTLYEDDVFDEKDKTALRKKINEAWKEVYNQLGRNKSVPLSDDDFLRAHWIIYFRYSRKRGDDYIKFLLSKFSSKGIFEKTPVLVEAETEPVISDDVADANDTETAEAEELETIEVSKLQPTEIEDYVNSLKNMAKYWYDTHFPFESENENLTQEEKKRVDRLNRIGIGHFRPFVMAVISRSDISASDRIKIFEAIERFIFIAFRLGNFNASYGSSDYYRAARQVYMKEKDVDELCREINNRTTNDVASATQIFVTRIEKYFSTGNGYYNWNSLRYFFYEYEAKLAEKNNIDRLCTWSMFTKSEKDKVSIEHILPQTPTKFYWRNMFRQFKDSEIKMLSGALGNLLPLSQSVNSALQNDSFEDKKHSKTAGRRGYENGSHSEIEVSKLQDWTAFEIYNRTEKLLIFMQERWNLKFNEDQLKKLIGISFVKDEREIPEELEEVSTATPETEDNADGSGEDQKLQFWTAFVNYANEHGRASDIAKQKALGRTCYDVHLGANGYHLFFSIPYGNRIKMGIYTYNVDAYNRLKESKDQIEAEFGESLNWEYSKPTGQTRSIIIEEKADDFNPSEQPKIFNWIIDHFDRITTALSLAGERLSLGGDSSETSFEIRKHYWTYALVQIHKAHGNPGSFSNVNPSTDNWINGFFGISGFYLCCVANFDSARSEVVFAKAKKSENKAAFDALHQHKDEIESKLGTKLQWNRGDDIKSSKVFIQLDGVSIENEDDWPQMAQFHAEWSKKFYDVIVPYIKG